MHWFYSNEIIGHLFTTSQEESKHISRVLRLKVGDLACFTDGLGKTMKCTLIDDSPKKCKFEVIENTIVPKPRDFNLHIAVAPTKNIARFEWFLEKATEIGIDEITPLVSDHSERMKLKAERFEKILQSAIKQSQQSWKPRLNELTPLESLIVNDHSEQKFIAYVSDSHTTLLKETLLPKKDVLILIGPEGDFSESEIRLAIENNFSPISLGANRLRTETAALVACHTVVIINQ